MSEKILGVEGNNIEVAKATSAPTETAPSVGPEMVGQVPGNPQEYVQRDLRWFEKDIDLVERSVQESPLHPVEQKLLQAWKNQAAELKAISGNPTACRKYCEGQHSYLLAHIGELEESEIDDLVELIHALEGTDPSAAKTALQGIAGRIRTAVGGVRG